MGHVTHTHESRHMYQSVVLRIWMNHVPNMNVSIYAARNTYTLCHTYKWVMSHVRKKKMSQIWTCPSMQREIHTPYVTHINESWVTWHMWTSHVTIINESHHIYECVMSPKKCVHLCAEKYAKPPDPTNHVKISQGPAPPICPSGAGTLTGSKHFRLIILIRQKSTTQPGWVIQRVQCFDALLSSCIFVPSDE